MKAIALLAVLTIVPSLADAQEMYLSWDLVYDEDSTTLFSVQSDESGDNLDRSFSCGSDGGAFVVRWYRGPGVEAEDRSLSGAGRWESGCDRTCKQVSALTYARETADFAAREPDRVWVEHVAWSLVRGELEAQMLRGSYLNNYDEIERKSVLTKNKEIIGDFESACMTE